MENLEEKIKAKRYATYKNTFFEWMGEIPSEWETKKVKSIFRLVVEPAPKNNQFELLSVYTDIGVKPRRELEERGNKASTTDGYWFVKKGDVVVNKLLAWMGAIGVSNYDGVTSPAYDILRPREKINSNYFHYLFRNEACISELRKHSRGIMDMRLRLYFDKFGDIFVPSPSFSDQEKIVNFLDKKTALIDKAIAIKQKQIELLKERRQILIHNAVTRGLNPDVKMKDSGVEWIGEVPEHWEVLPGLRFFSENKKSNKGMKQDVVLSLSYGKVIIKPIEKLVGLVPESFETYQIVEPGDIIIRGTDLQNDKTSLRTGIANDHGIITSAYINLSLKKYHNPKYIHSYLHALDITKVLYKFGTGLRQNLSFVDFKKMPVLFVPREEQDSIVAFIEIIEAKIQKCISLKLQEIEKLKEYKSTLINSAVTGKIKVT